MARQPALVLARPRTVPALSGRRRRGAIVGACIVSVLGLLYLGARETLIFALRTIEVEGAPAEVRRSVLQTLEETRGTSLVTLDGDSMVRRLEALPSVQSVTYDRAFPHTLRLEVVAEKPVAVLDQGSARWVTSVRGRVIARTTAEAGADLPHIRYDSDTPLAEGRFVSDVGVKTVLAALADAPRRMLLPIQEGRLEDGELTFELAGEGGSRPLLLLGEPVDVWTKLRVAALVLRELDFDERAALTYLDVALPDRPVASTNPLVSSRG